MNRIILFAGLFWLIIHSACAQEKRPRLVVGIVVDQMRHDYLQRFEGKFTDQGFKKLMKEGFEARNTQYNYIPTYTAPGHASIYTGTTPKYHGIISNSWYSRILDRSVYCVEDTTARNVGDSSDRGSMSPRNLLTNTITDELKLTSNFKSKVIGVSIKDRGSVLPAGHLADGAYWFDDRNGNFTTSDYYMDKLPGWMANFNNRELVDEYTNQVWNTLLPIEKYTESTPDDTPYEGGFKGKDTPTFPYDLAKLRDDNGRYGIIRSTPYGNTLVFDVAKAAIEGEELGSDEMTDFIAVSLSSTDYIGHNFAPNSIEVEDTYLRLDRDLGNFIDYLDQQVGEGDYLIFLTSDHGAVENPSLLMDKRLPGGYFSQREAFAQVQKAINGIYGNGNWILDVSNGQVFLNRNTIEEAGIKLEEIERAVANELIKADFMLDVLVATDLNRTDYSDRLKSRIQNGYNRKLSGDILAIFKPGYLSGSYGNTGTTHGSGFNYDTHVPLLFYGAGIKKGSTVRETMITDIAPTIAMLLNISLPNAAVSGNPIIELFE